MATETVYIYLGDRSRAEGVLTVAMRLQDNVLRGGVCMTPVGRSYVKGFSKLVADFRLEFAVTGVWPAERYAERFANYTKFRSDLRNACLSLEDFQDKAYAFELQLDAEDQDRVGQRVSVIKYLCSQENPMAPSLKKFIRQLWYEATFASSMLDNLSDADLAALASGQAPACGHDHSHDEFPS